MQLREAEEQSAFQAVRDVVAADHAAFEQRIVDFGGRKRAADDELLEEFFVGCQLVAIEGRDLAGRVVRLVIAQLCHPSQALFAERRERDGERQRDELGAGADV